MGTQNKIFGKNLYLSYMKKIIKLTESDLIRIVKRVINEGSKEKIEKIFTNKVLENKSNILSELENDERVTLDVIESEMKDMFPDYYKMKVGFSGFNNKGEIIYSISLRAYLTPRDLEIGNELLVTQVIKTKGPESWGFRYM